MNRDKLLIELTVKSLIVFICVGFIVTKYSSYIIDNFGGIAYIAFVFLLNIIAFFGFTNYFKHKVKRYTHINLFHTYYNKCVSGYVSCKNDIILDSEKFFSDPVPLISSLGLHEFIIKTYVVNEKQEEFDKLKHFILLSVCNKDVDGVLQEVEALSKLLSNSDFKYKIKIK